PEPEPEPTPEPIPEPDPEPVQEPDPEPEPEPEPEPIPFTPGEITDDRYTNEWAGLRFLLPGEGWHFSDARSLGALAGSGEEESGAVVGMQAVSEGGANVLVLFQKADSLLDGEGREPSESEYAGALADGMLAGGSDGTKAVGAALSRAGLAGGVWTRATFPLTFPEGEESSSVWYVQKRADGWFVTVAVTESPADWITARQLSSLFTAPDAPLPALPKPPARDPVFFRWGGDSEENGVYRNPFAGIRIAAAEGWTFETRAEIAGRNGMTGPEDAETFDARSSRCAASLNGPDGATIRLNFVKLDALGGGEDGWLRYAGFMVQTLREQGEASGFAVTADEGEEIAFAGEAWYAQILTYSHDGYAVGQQMLLWRTVEDDLAELILDDGILGSADLKTMAAMISKEGE
ncbi:MAG: hypothetical protein IIU08_10000, partial [Clostridia bacterium]|nr:hypothetical protein [Clostridia bacterium]